jgi:hypothetical protein
MPNSFALVAAGAGEQRAEVVRKSLRSFRKADGRRLPPTNFGHFDVDCQNMKEPATNVESPGTAINFGRLDVDCQGMNSEVEAREPPPRHLGLFDAR